ncbi:MAG: HerA helicase [Candidatus Methanohalarchaeum thermophilum]|uniref:HerA helicase n=1 Tax=Methanohalarchaeum thermophilum TaxID=1903181 RepID=A0A1Q6DVD4_METT1|nr:MAG: HerA helicase [Candidatus Methanohalarchaeum thermophilum]
MSNKIKILEITKNKDISLDVLDILTGRSFITGKSGSGESNSASVIGEELGSRKSSIYKTINQDKKKTKPKK